ncbi:MULTISPECIES: hypothetical protein [unclassified Microbacterium]|uniref:hypothetical protein n=1 Tax=unclassified Microbacterium TaxID=2609290 RepID=UPI00044C8154|nr:hypothetical protein [Microbacterium sp. MRS-1]EXJ51475.1 hypothetical protein AS96_09190 [Microbacterium sp. MRS-1]
MNSIAPTLEPTANPTSPPAIPPKVDPIVIFYVSDANAAAMRAMTVVTEELEIHGRLSIDASTLELAHELAGITTAFAEALTAIANQADGEPAGG